MSTAIGAWNQAKHEAQELARQVDEQTAFVRQTSSLRWQQLLGTALAMQIDPQTRFEGHQMVSQLRTQIEAKRSELNKLSDRVDVMISQLASKTVTLPKHLQISANLERSKLCKELDQGQQVARRLSCDIQHVVSKACRRHANAQLLKRRIKSVISPFEGMFRALKQAYGPLV